jgi:lipopolysaccharide cholinephosphotransferase
LRDVQKLFLYFYPKIQKFFDDNRIRFYVIAGGVLGAIRHQGFIPWDDDIDFGLFRPDYEKFLLLCSHLDSTFFFVENYRNTKCVDHALTRIYFKGTYFPNPKTSPRLSQELYCDVFPLDFLPESVKQQEKQSKKLAHLKRLLYIKSIRNSTSFKKNMVLKAAKIPLLFISSRRIAQKMDYWAHERFPQVDTHQVCSMMSQYSYQKQTMPVSLYGSGCQVPFENTKIKVPEDYHGYLLHLYGPNFMIPVQRKSQSENTIVFVNEKVLSFLK